MKVQTFMGKATIEGLHQLNQHINEWIKKHEVVPAHIQQSFGSEQHHDGRNSESTLVISIWWEGTDIVEDGFDD
jgi:hypothetical protein